MEPMYRAMDLLGDPQHCAPVIHLTGTNGKTSTAGMIETMLNSYGLSTGRYTSPHLVKFTERMTLNSEPVDDETVLRVWSEILPVVRLVDQELLVEDETPLTYFEAMTVLAFAVFADAPVDVMVLEVGLGGITDATNVADAQVSVVTPISLDHTDLLGETVEEIAEEKAGIIKPDGYVVSAAQEPAAAQVLLDKAREVGASFAFENLEFGVARPPGGGRRAASLGAGTQRYIPRAVPATPRPPSGRKSRGSHRSDGSLPRPRRSHLEPGATATGATAGHQPGTAGSASYQPNLGD